MKNKDCWQEAALWMLWGLVGIIWILIIVTVVLQRVGVATDRHQRHASSSLMTS